MVTMHQYFTPPHIVLPSHLALLYSQHLDIRNKSKFFTFPTVQILQCLCSQTELIMATSPNTSTLLRYLSQDLKADTVPEEVWLRTEDLFLDWLASALASKTTHPIPIFEATARQMGSKDGRSQVFPGTSLSSPYWASWVNAAASHTLEQDDLHNSSVMHPAT